MSEENDYSVRHDVSQCAGATGFWAKEKLESRSGDAVAMSADNYFVNCMYQL